MKKLKQKELQVLAENLKHMTEYISSLIKIAKNNASTYHQELVDKIKNLQQLYRDQNFRDLGIQLALFTDWLFREN